MKPALWTKLKSVGPPLDFDSEMQRFIFWLPTHVRPFALRVRRWRKLYLQAADVNTRVKIEQQALLDLRRSLSSIPERALIFAFLKKVEDAYHLSLATRRDALTGTLINTKLDDELIDSLEVWLEACRGHREVRSWLLRMLRAWRVQRNRPDN
ncbi:hypothetical protein [Dongshaea marina]|uniref:hypothetical protein n=1 Tax=Dongshaea marina TaxID=2047966 RepID=UPI000D3E8821|nr:hypothetical protein [Dongshaea marina]